VVTVNGSNTGIQATSTFTSYANGKNIPGALNVEFNFPVATYNVAQGNAQITVHGVGLQMISQAANLNGANITLSAGMKPGLPLATAAANNNQAGVILQGKIYQAYGNWQGTDQTLEIVCNGSPAQPDLNIPFSWLKGTSLQSAITAALYAAFPTFKTIFAISSALQTSADIPNQATSLSNFADFLQQTTQAIGATLYGPQYPGVQITLTGTTFTVYDTTQSIPTKQIAFQDLIGQPTWINPGTVQFKTVLRADIGLNYAIQFPAGISSPYALTSPAAAQPNAPVSSKTSFQNKWLINEVHHWANFRQADADSWNTTFTAYPFPVFTPNLLTATLAL
jgi:hypothetical protein